jgi:hypothetical protein
MRSQLLLLTDAFQLDGILQLKSYSTLNDIRTGRGSRKTVVGSLLSVEILVNAVVQSPVLLFD